MADAEVDICNLALGLIGDFQISALTETSSEARICNRFYHPTRRSTLTMYDWNCASSTAALSLLQRFERDPNRTQWRFAYKLPSDSLVVREILCPVRNLPPIPYAVSKEGDFIVLNTDFENPTVRYTQDLSDTAIFSEPFRQAFYHRLAATITLPLTQKSQLYELVVQRAQSAVMQSMAADANESFKDKRRDASWVRNRGVYRVYD